METKKIQIVVTEKTVTKEGKEIKFNTYKTRTKNGRILDVKFRKEVENLPAENFSAIICVDDMNYADGDYPVLWVKAVQSFEEYKTLTAKEINKKKIDELFD